MDAPTVVERNKRLRDTKLLSASVFAATVAKGRKQGTPLAIFSSSIADTNKALAKLDKKNHISKEALLELVPKELHDKVSVWYDDKAGDRLVYCTVLSYYYVYYRTIIFTSKYTTKYSFER